MTDDEKRMTFIEHLAELRTRIIHTGVVAIVAVLACYVFSNFILETLAYPLTPLAEKGLLQHEVNEEAAPNEQEAEKEMTIAGSPSWTILNPLEIVFVKIKLAGYGGLLVTLPYLLWQICAFVFPGLKPTEKHVVKIMLVGCSVLGVTGVLVAYFGVLPFVLPYLASMVPDGWHVQMRASETLSIIIKALVGFAIAFQFPMGVLVLVYLGLLTPETLKKYRRVAIVGMAVCAAMLTPPDPITMMVMLMPLVLLYEGSIWLAYLVVRRKKTRPDS